MKHHHFPCEALNWTWTGQRNFKKLEGDAKWHRIQSVSHTLIFQVFFNITSVLEFVYSHFFTLYLICMWLLFIMPVIKLLFLTIVLPGDFVVARRAFWRETEMAILVARTYLPVWDFQKLASLPVHSVKQCWCKRSVGYNCCSALSTFRNLIIGVNSLLPNYISECKYSTRLASGINSLMGTA